MVLYALAGSGDGISIILSYGPSPISERGFLFESHFTTTMKNVYINELGPKVSAAVYGFWRWNEADFKDPSNFNKVVEFTRELGINTYDLSPAHANGLVEENFGKLLKNGLKRNDLVISSKAGVRPFSGSNGSGTYIDLSPKWISQSVEDSLKRLQIEKLDILILEGFDFLYSFEETASTLLKLQRSGKIGHIGVSNFNVFQQRLLSNYLSQPIITNHIELNLLQTEALTDGRIDFIREQHSRALAFSPLADGRILLGDDEKAVRVRNLLEKIARSYDANIEQTAVAWVHQLGALPIIGSKETRRIQNASTAYDIKLSKEDWNLLYQETLK